MKKKLNLLMIILFVAVFGAQAQQGGNGAGQRRTTEERVKMLMDKITDSLKLDAKEVPATTAAFTDYYNAQNKLRESITGGGRPDRDAMMKLTNDRDEVLKKIWTDEQFKKYKEMEASMRQRGGGQRPQQGQENK